MNSDNDRTDPLDAHIAIALESQSPPTPNDFQSRVRSRMRANFIQQQSVAGLRAAVVVMVLALFVQLLLKSGKQINPASNLSAAELDFLFAPPPVDSLAVLDRQQQIAYRTLQRWETNR